MLSQLVLGTVNLPDADWFILYIWCILSVEREVLWPVRGLNSGLSQNVQVGPRASVRCLNIHFDGVHSFFLLLYVVLILLNEKLLSLFD